MKDDLPKAGADRRASADIDHEINYAVEVLQREFPKISPDKIKRAINSAHTVLPPSADRWQRMAYARGALSR